jgi:hypothetical protein
MGRKNSTRRDDVQELAGKLDAWAQEELTEPQRTLLRLLVSRCQELIPQIEIKGPAYAYKTDIKQAVMDALRDIDYTGNPVRPVPPSPAENWARAPVWSRARPAWPRA